MIHSFRKSKRVFYPEYDWYLTVYMIKDGCKEFT